MKAGPVGEMVGRIVAGFDPLKVILFGSLARGEAGYDSDVDLLVVMPDGIDDERWVTVGILRALKDLPISKDVVVTTPKEIERRGHLVGTVLRPALREGKVLYERPGLHSYSRGRVPGGFYHAITQTPVFGAVLAGSSENAGALLPSATPPLRLAVADAVA